MSEETLDTRLEKFSKLWAESGAIDESLVLKNKNLMAYLNSGGFFTAPASTKYHGVYEGGLFDHSYAVTKRLIQLTENNGLRWKRPDSPFIVGMFHDLCKCDQYVKKLPGPPALGFEYEETVYEYNDHMVLKGHGSKSVMILSQFINLTAEELLCIRYHMGPYEKVEYDWGDYDRAIKVCGNILWVHHADLLASKIDGV